MMGKDGKEEGGEGASYDFIVFFPLKFLLKELKTAAGCPSYGQANPETAVRPFQGWPAHRA
jgi:hypothetical protein